MLDIHANKFGIWTVHQKVGIASDFGLKTRDAMYLCTCGCGTQKTVRARDLRAGYSKSCGCLNRAPRLHARKLDTDIHEANIYRSIYRGALARKLDFSLSKDEVLSLVFHNCHYCDSAPRNISKIPSKKMESRSTLAWNGLDRKDSSQGYSLDNVVPCCKFCNKAKQVLGYNDFTAWINQIRRSV